MFNKLLSWFDNHSVQLHADVDTVKNQWHTIDWLRVAPFILMHVACFAVLFVGFSWFALGFALVLYLIRMFAITAFYHRYFSHRAFRTTRVFQFILALIGATAVQRGPIWWASHHRHHHLYSDETEDAHSPVQHGFLWSHIGWFLSSKHFTAQTENVKELSRYTELRLLDRFDAIIPVILAVGIYLLGDWLAHAYPNLSTNGMQLLVWGFAVSTVVLYHATFTVNSLAHVWGKRRYATTDQSRNNFWIALATLGEGWHNNHHHYPATAKQGFFWWELDMTYYVLKLFEKLRMIREVRGVPKLILKKNLINNTYQK